MPVGELDRRRAGHRCEPCKKLHAKCNGSQPCSNCVARGLDCIVATKARSKDFRFVYQQRKSLVVPRPLIQDSWNYISIYFQSVGYLTQVSVLRSPTVTTLSHEDENVSRTLSIIGGIYATHNRSFMQIDQGESHRIMGTFLKQKSIIERQLENPDISKFSSILLNALLLGVVELIFNREENSFGIWLYKVSRFLNQYHSRRESESLTAFSKSLIRVFQMLDVLLAIARVADPIGPRYSSCPYPMTQQPIGPDQEVKSWSEDMKMDGMLSAMWQWATLRLKMVCWINTTEKQQQEGSSSNGSHSPPPISVEKKIQGLDIICEASSLQIHMIENLFQLSQSPQDHVSNCITPYYHWALTGLSHTLRHEMWKLLSCEVPLMPDEALHQQALVALDCVETLLDKPGMDLALYLPVADMVGHQMETEAERARMMKFLNIVVARGFNVADEYRQLLLGVWSGSDSPAADTAKNECGWGV